MEKKYDYNEPQSSDKIGMCKEVSCGENTVYPLTCELCTRKLIAKKSIALVKCSSCRGEVKTMSEENAKKVAGMDYHNKVYIGGE